MWQYIPCVSHRILKENVHLLTQCLGFFCVFAYVSCTAADVAADAAVASGVAYSPPQEVELRGVRGQWC